MMTTQIQGFYRSDPGAIALFRLFGVSRWVTQAIATIFSLQHLSIKSQGAFLPCSDSDGQGDPSLTPTESSPTTTEILVDQEQRRYQAILEDQTELICRYLSDTTILYVNDAYCHYFGLQKHDLIGKSYAPVIYEADRPMLNG